MFRWAVVISSVEEVDRAVSWNCGRLWLFGLLWALLRFPCVSATIERIVAASVSRARFRVSVGFQAFGLLFKQSLGRHRRLPMLSE